MTCDDYILCIAGDKLLRSRFVSSSSTLPPATAALPEKTAAMATSDPQAAASSGPAASQGDSAGGAAVSNDQRVQKDVSAQIMDILTQEGTAIDSGKLKVEEITAQRKALQQERKRLTAKLRNENRERQRIRRRSQYLSNEDLVDVLSMRKSKMDAAAAQSKPKAAAAKSKAKPRDLKDQ